MAFRESIRDLSGFLEIRLDLPWPPSLNTYWRRVGNKTLISKRGREYRTAVAAAVMQAGTAGAGAMADRLAVTIEAYPPDRRRRDLDNLPKAILDGLTHAGVWLDDEQIDDLRVVRGGVKSLGIVRVTIQPIAATREHRGFERQTL